MPCQLGKSKQLPFNKFDHVSSRPLELIHSDVWTSPVLSINGFKSYVLFIDDFSRYSWLFPLKFKSDLFGCFVKFKCIIENQLSCKIKQLQTDGGGEYTSNSFTKFLNDSGIYHRFTCPHISQQNGIAERKHRHICETGLTLLAQSHLPSKYWVEAFHTAVYSINRLPSSVLQFEIPLTKLFNKEPDFSLLKTFGCACYPHLRPYTKHKLEFRSKQCVFLGYGSNQKGYKCLDLQTNKIYMSRHVVFDENLYPAQEKGSTHYPARGQSSPSGTVLLPFHFYSLNSPTIPMQSSQQMLTSNHVPSDHLRVETTPITNSTSNTETTSAFNPVDSAIAPTPSQTSNLLPALSPTQILTNTSEIDSTPTSTSTSLPAFSPTQIITRSMTGNSKPKQFHDYHLYLSNKSTNHPIKALHTSFLPCEPKSCSKAVSNPDWFAAMQSEYQALLDNQTWSLCPRPKDRNVIHNKWVYKLKQKPDGTIDRYKARLVAKGFEQRDGIDYTETFSPVIKPATIRLLLAIALHFDWPIKQLDVSNAFLHGFLNEEVFMEQPQGFVDRTFPNHVCRLHKAIYGLKQAPRAWYTRLTQALQGLGFTGSLLDTSLFMYHNDSVHIYVLIYVDDILVTGSHSSSILGLIQSLQKEFKMKDLGDLSYFLGIHVHRTSTGMHLNQAKYIYTLLDRTNMLGAKPYSAPCVSGQKLSKLEGDPLPDPTIYRHIVGALQYCTLTRPDISYSVNQLCQFLHCPTTVHFTAAKRVLRYLKGTIDHGLFFQPGPLQLAAYCDSDWAGDPLDRRSTSGYGVFLGNCLISWQAKKQPIVSRSSTEAEYRAMAFATAELYWLRMLFKDLQCSIKSTPQLWCDNMGALALASNPIFHARTKHVEVDYHFIREKVLNKDIIPRYISTADQIADVFTKGLTSSRFLLLKDKLMVTASPISLTGDVKSIISVPTLNNISTESKDGSY